jgi:UDP-glucuronate 4-epimerase
MTDTYLVTGAMGCIGAWTLYHLVQQDKRVVSVDLSDDRHRLNALMSDEQQAAISFVQGDITDFEWLKTVFSEHGITHVIHLAALQVPFCRANPVLGSQVNVVGTVNIFEAAHQHKLSHITYASSIAVYGPPDDYPPGLIAHDAPVKPRTLYGVYKVANEGTANVYWQDHQVSSIVLRPYTVYGVGRDQGMTSEPTKAMLAAARGEDCHISFGGKMQFHYASDVALQFIEAAEQSVQGAVKLNLGTAPISVGKIAEIIMQLRPNVSITYDDRPLPFPEGCDPSEFHRVFDRVYETSLEDGIRKTIELFEK